MNSKFKLNKNFEEYKSFLLHIKDYFSKSETTIHKARNELKIIECNGIDTVVKCFKVPNIINKIAYSFFRDSKAKKSYDYSLKIGDFTPKPIGYIEFYESALLTNSYFVSEKFDYDFTIREPLLDDDFENKDEILKAFARFSYSLHEYGIFHKDYSPGNILIKKVNDDYEFKIVDINRMQFGTLDMEQRALNFSKLWARDDELTIMAKEYLTLYDTNESFIERVCFYSNKNKRIKNFKKRLKGQKVTD